MECFFFTAPFNTCDCTVFVGIHRIEILFKFVLETADFARRNQYAVVMSERSGETEDSILSDISVALNAGLFKTGGLRGSDRGTNYNRFMEIEAELASAAFYAGIHYRRDPGKHRQKDKK